VDVEGVVTYDGEPVTAGIVSFVPGDGDARSAGAGGGAVVDGRYHIYPESGLKPGRYRVEIRWGKPTGEKNMNAGYGQSPDVIAEALPDKYHAQSILTADLVFGKNTVDFRLEK
jgi:hypothetical protein